MPTLKLPVRLDISFGGMFYAVVQTDSIDELPPLEPQNGKLIAALGCQILVSKVDWAKFKISHSNWVEINHPAVERKPRDVPRTKCLETTLGIEKYASPRWIFSYHTFDITKKMRIVRCRKKIRHEHLDTDCFPISFVTHFAAVALSFQVANTYFFLFVDYFFVLCNSW